MKIAKFEYSLFGINTYAVYDADTKDCAVIDPGMINSEEEDALRNFVTRNGLRVTHIINTHLHIDHAVGNAYAAKVFDAPVYAHKEDEFMGKRLRSQAESFGIEAGIEDVSITSYLTDGEELHIGNGTLEVLEVPGHSPGSIALYDRQDGFVITGDALFAGSIGRTDLPKGDFGTLISSIRNRLLTLPPGTTVFPGHGPATTIARESASNPFLR